MRCADNPAVLPGRVITEKKHLFCLHTAKNLCTIESGTAGDDHAHRKGGSEMISIEDFNKVEMRAGTVLDVKDNKKSRNPAYVVTIDFGEELGIKKSSAQITALYKPEDLIGTQVICCVNLTPIHIGSVKSEVRILGTESEQGVVLLRPAEPVKNGDKVF